MLFGGGALVDLSLNSCAVLVPVVSGCVHTFSIQIVVACSFGLELNSFLYEVEVIVCCIKSASKYVESNVNR